MDRLTFWLVLALAVLAVRRRLLMALLGNASTTASPPNMSPRMDGKKSVGPQERLALGSERPTGSGKYCSDELPYCCPGVSVDPILRKRCQRLDEIASPR